MDKDVIAAQQELSKVLAKKKANKMKAMLPALGEAAKGRDVLPTNEAAVLINRSPQTLRKWACMKNGPITPVHIFGRLAWRVSDLNALLNGDTPNAI